MALLSCTTVIRLQKRSYAHWVLSRNKPFSPCDLLKRLIQWFNWQLYLSQHMILDTFVEIDHEKISTVILLPSADYFKKGCCQLQAKVRAQITG